MRKLIILLPALLLLGGGLRMALPGDPPHAPTAPRSEDAVPPVRHHAEPVTTIDESVTPEPVESEARSESLAVQELVSLLAVLDESVRLRPTTFPKSTLEELAALLTEYPDAVDRLVADLPTLSRGVRSWLMHAVQMIQDRRVHIRLKAALAASDPDRDRIERALRDPVSIVTALESSASPRDRKNLISQLTARHLSDRGVTSKLRDLVENDEDAGVRMVAIYRLAKFGNRSHRSLVLGVLTDPTRHAKERRAAAMALRFSTEDDVLDAYLDIVRRAEDAVAVLVFAAEGLSSMVGQAEADDVLFRLLLNRDQDLKARKSSAVAIAEGASNLAGTVRSRLEDRAYNALHDLSQEPGAKEIHAYAQSQFTDSLGKAFADRVNPDGAAQSSVSQEQEVR